MKAMIHILFLSAFIFSCTKNKFVEFPKGKFKLVDFNYENVCYTNTFITDIDLFHNIFEFDGKKHITFESDKGEEKFKIIDCKTIIRETFFQKEGVYSDKYLLLILKKDLKKFYFKFHVINDSTIIGVHWKKNQVYYSVDKPNVSYYSCSINSFTSNTSVSYYSNNNPPQQSFHTTEIFGVFRKIND